MLKPTERFTTRVENYVKYRPGYPECIIDLFEEECGLTPEWKIADIGSGTGISTELFLKNGNPTIGVEPNDAMREAAEKFLEDYSNFTSVNGTAEETNLPDSSIDMVAAGQAFHWFHLPGTKREFKRILKENGWIVLFWNDRITTGTPFLEAYEELLRDFSIDYDKANHRKMDEAVLTDFYSPHGYKMFVFDNRQSFDLEGLTGRFLSSSYAPEPGHPKHEPMIAELKSIFEENSKNGLVTFEYHTIVNVGKLT